VLDKDRKSPEEKKMVKARWVYRLKTEGDKRPYKARLVAKV